MTGKMVLKPISGTTNIRGVKLQFFPCLDRVATLKGPKRNFKRNKTESNVRKSLILSRFSGIDERAFWGFFLHVI